MLPGDSVFPAAPVGAKAPGRQDNRIAGCLVLANPDTTHTTGRIRDQFSHPGIEDQVDLPMAAVTVEYIDDLLAAAFRLVTARR